MRLYKLVMISLWFYEHNDDNFYFDCLLEAKLILTCIYLVKMSSLKESFYGNFCNFECVLRSQS